MMYGIEDANITRVVQVSVLNQNDSMGSSRIACYGVSDYIQGVSCWALDSALKTTVSRYQSVVAIVGRSHQRFVLPARCSNMF